MYRFWVYILTNPHHTVLYTGFTEDLEVRVYQHKHKLLHGFTKKYNCNKLVYFEEFVDGDEAKHREHQIKRYPKKWKHNLINSMNPEWRDLYLDLIS